MRDSDMAPPSLAMGTRVGEFIVGERLGVGGFSEVFRVSHPVIGKDAAMKVLDRRYCDDQAAINRFIDEARATNLLKHRGVVDVFAFGELDDGRMYYVMELLEGQTLAAMLAVQTRLSLAEALPILRGIAVAVDAAHAAGIAHRDLKPGNVFVLPDGSTKLIDFGIAKLVRDASRVATETGSVLGTPQYMSPEQCRGRGSDTRSDAYSFGALAYHTLVGEPPFSGEPLEIALHHLNDRPIAPSRRVAVPSNVDRVVLALLEKDPALRPMPLVSAVDALEGARLKRTWSSRAKLAAIAAPVLIGGVAFAIASRDGEPAEPEQVAPDVGMQSCKHSSRQLANLWDTGVRSSLARRFADSERSKQFWTATSAALDTFASDWSVAWDIACGHPDSQLGHAQRLACVDNALLDLRASVDALRTTDVPTLIDGFDAEGLDGMRGRKLFDCNDRHVVRSQIAPPAPELRDRVAGLLLDATRAWMQASIAFQKRDTKALDAALDRHAALANQVEQLDAPSAAMLISDRAGLLVAHAFDVDQQRRPEARRVLLDGLRRIESSGDNVAIASAYVALGDLEAALGDGDPAAKLAELLPRIETAVTRAGGPKLPKLRLELLRSRLAMLQGRYGDAVAILRAVSMLARDHGTLDDQATVHRWLGLALIEAGDPRAAVQDSEEREGYARRRYGEDRAVSALMQHAMVLDAAGRLDEAIAAREVVAKRLQSIGEHAPIWGRAYTLDLAFRQGKRPAEAAELLVQLAAKGTTPPRGNPDGPATARRAGMFELFAAGANTDDHRAILAFERGHPTTTARAVVESCKRGCSDWIRFSRWLVDDANFSALEAEYGHDKSAIAYTGIALAARGDWKAARAKLELARGVPNIWESQADLTELDGWLGLARVAAGDLVGARVVFEEGLLAMSIAGNGFDGFSYMTPSIQLALAELLWHAHDGDRPRARLLVTRAVAGFARLGKTAERASAERWLRDH